MPISVVCPPCARKLRAPDKAAGRRTKCPKCGTTVVIPITGEEFSEPIDADARPQSINSVEPSALRSKSPPAPTPPTAETISTFLPSRKPNKNGSRAGLWIAMAVGIFVFFAVTIGVALWATGFFVSGRTPKLTEKQKAAAADAIKALGRIEAAVEVGVNFQQYSQLLIDAKPVVNEAERMLPVGEMVKDLTENMNAYKDAREVWSHKIQYPSIGGKIKKEYGFGDIITGYNLQVDQKQEADSDTAMQIIWGVAATKLAHARSLQ